MRAVWLVLVAGFRRQWRSWLLLGVLIAVASGFVLAATAAGGVRLGTVITLPMAGASQRQAVFNAMNGKGPPPKKATGPRMAMRVVGIVAAENEFSSGQGTTYDLYTGPAFAVATKGSPALTTYYVRLRHGQATLPRSRPGQLLRTE